MELLSLIELIKKRNLKSLDLKWKNLTTLPKEIYELTDLTYLDLSNNKFKTLPEEISRFTKLQFLYVNNNMLTSITPEIGKLSNLKILEMSNNDLTSLPEEVYQLTNLEKLDLNCNHLKSISQNIGWLKNLQSLYLHNNNLSALLTEISQLTSLQSLFLDNNQLVELPSEIGLLSNLKALGLSGNKLRSLPPEFNELRNLVTLLVYGNPFELPPIEIAYQGVKAIRNYFKSLIEEGEEQLYEAKLIIVGQGNAGKTCLTENLINSSYGINDTKALTTRGISIKKWKWLHKDFEFTANIWDFGGQEIYHSTHQFFLTKRSLYLLVWDARKDEENMMSFGYWLNIISLLSAKSPIIMVLNKIDERSAEIDEISIKSTFNNVFDFRKISCKYGTGITDLIEIIQNMIVRLPLVGTKWPKIWSKIREKLECDERDYIDYLEYLNICLNYGLNQEQANFLSSYLHDLGIILHYQDDSLLKNTVILKPKWGTDAVYKALDTKKINDKKGRFCFNDLELIWEEYPSNKHNDLLQLMIKFELCFKLADTNEYIIPELLSPERPEFIWSHENNLIFEYRYKFMPAGIITRFIVRNHKLIYNNIYWHFGVVLIYENATRALIISSPLERKIVVKIIGSEVKEFLAIIRNEFAQIHETLNNPEVNEFIPCICNECKNSQNKALFDYTIIKKFITKNIKQTNCPTSAEFINLEELITGIEDKNMIENDVEYINNFNLTGGTLIMGNDVKQNYGNTIVFGNEAKLNNVTISQCQNGLENCDLDNLGDEFSKLLQEMRKIAEKTEEFIEMGKVAEAEKAAKHGDKGKVINALKGIGNWSFNIASNIGTKIAADVIGKAIGV